jgi:hypothetical protein
MEEVVDGCEERGASFLRGRPPMPANNFTLVFQEVVQKVDVIPLPTGE